MDLSRRLSLLKLQLRLALRSGPKTLDLQQSQLVVQLGFPLMHITPASKAQKGIASPTVLVSVVGATAVVAPAVTVQAPKSADQGPA